MNWFTALINAVAYYYKVHATKAAYELQRDIEFDISEHEKEINRLRALGDPASQLIADRLLARVIRSQGVASSVEPAGGIETIQGNAGPKS